MLKAVAPWKDRHGNTIYAGDIIEFPVDDDPAVVVFLSPYSDPHRQWRAQFNNEMLSLALQISDRGMATVAPKTRGTKC